jgi:hypothetical protein
MAVIPFLTQQFPMEPQVGLLQVAAGIPLLLEMLGLAVLGAEVLVVVALLIPVDQEFLGKEMQVAVIFHKAALARAEAEAVRVRLV